MVWTELDRRLTFEGCFNFRDLGGYRARDGRTVRWRRLFRSDALNYMSPSDVELARGNLRIATVFDLRTPEEIRRDGLGPLMVGPIGYFHRPVIAAIRESSEEKSNGNPEALADRYLGFLEEGAQQIANIIRQLSSSAVYPAVFHCAAGKDRTGIVSAVVLSLLGVGDDTIVADYALSNEGVPQVIERMRSTPGYWEIVGDRPVETFMVKSETIRGLLTRVNASYGSMQGFAEAQGVGADTVRRLQDLLLE